MQDRIFYIDNKPFSCIMNASGCSSKSKTQLDNLVKFGIKTIVSKTCTLYEKIGNSTPNFYEVNKHISINCLGMPNSGFTYFKNLLPYYNKLGITYIISISGDNLDELCYMLKYYDKFIYEMNEDTREFVEINVSCPNVHNGKLITYCPILLETLLEKITTLSLNNISIGLKLSPFVDTILLEQIAKVLIKYVHIVKYIVCGNSIPNGMIMDLETRQPLLSNKVGGISGSVNKLLSVSNTYQFVKLFGNIPIVVIGCGGIENINDIKEYLIAGAKGIQIGRLFYINDTEKLKKIFLSKL